LEEFRGFWRNSAEFGGIPPYQGIPRILEEFRGFWRISADFGGIPRILKEFRGIPHDFHGIPKEILRNS
jgi:hypothetical protein